MIRKSFLVQGLVQGVGFRPFVYKTAMELGLVGFVKNSINGVELEVEGLEESIYKFEDAISSKLPPLARVDRVDITELKLLNEKSFEILQSSDDSKKKLKTALIPPDIATCQECLADIKSTENKKYYNYFSTNCTNCGPRYSIIKTIPYDRANTSMKKFSMCQSCRDEYTNKLNRRYHAQPISCNSCGPTLSLWQKDKKLKIDTKDIFKNVATLIKAGQILCIKGLGGFHIVCDSTNDEVIFRLREYKNRVSKPFALMCRDIEQIKTLAHVNKKEQELLRSKEAPIVVLKKLLTPEIKISTLLAPKIDRVGCFLPYTALHHLLFNYLDNPIVATSANLGDEPIITCREDIFSKLPFVDFTLDYDRDIINGVDDTLLQVIGESVQTLRLARGYAPKVIKLPFKSKKKILAVGANAKSSIALCLEDIVITSPHIGDLDSLAAFEYFERTVETFKRFYGFEPDLIVHDKHPSYMTTKWAKEQNTELISVQHHLAHIYACKAEFGLRGDYLGFSFDGSGYGDDESLWGGEVFIGDKRKYHLKQIKLLGADKAVKEPRRVGLSMLFDKLSLEKVLELDLETVKAFSKKEIKILHKTYVKNLNSPLSSSVGRVFDGVASLSGISQKLSYEGESGLLCESFYDEQMQNSFNYTIENGIIDIKIIEYVLSFKADKTELNTMLINTLVNIIVDISNIERLEIILSGGVFQNRTLLKLVTAQLEKEKIRYYYQQETAINDGGIALGQVYYSLFK